MSLVIVSPCRQYLRLTLRKKVDSTQFIIHKGTFWRRFAMSRITISDDPNTASAIPSALERNARARARVHETTRMEFLRYRPEFTVARFARARARGKGASLSSYLAAPIDRAARNRHGAICESVAAHALVARAHRGLEKSVTPGRRRGRVRQTTVYACMYVAAHVRLCTCVRRCR